MEKECLSYRCFISASCLDFLWDIPVLTCLQLMAPYFHGTIIWSRVLGFCQKSGLCLQLETKPGNLISSLFKSLHHEHLNVNLLCSPILRTTLGGQWTLMWPLTRLRVTVLYNSWFTTFQRHITSLQDSRFNVKAKDLLLPQCCPFHPYPNISKKLILQIEWES